MSKKIVLYIDDDPVDNDQFIRHFDLDFEIRTIDFADITLDKLLEELDEGGFDYVIVDYHLNDKSACGFNGDEVLNSFLAKFPRFPAMLLTNHDEQALEKARDLDVEKIQSKKDYINNKDIFIKRIKLKIDQYHQKNKEYEDQIIDLLNKKNSEQELTANEENDLIKLDNLVEETLGLDAHKVPKNIMFSKTNTKKLDSLLKKTDQLIDTLKAYEKIQK